MSTFTTWLLGARCRCGQRWCPMYDAVTPDRPPFRGSRG